MFKIIALTQEASVFFNGLGSEFTPPHVFRMEAERRSQGLPVYNFRLGDIDKGLNIAPAFKKGMADALEEPIVYGASAGLPELRQLLVEKFRKTFNLTGDPLNVCVGPAKSFISKLILTLLNPGDRMALSAPNYPIWESWLGTVGAVKSPYIYRPDHTESLDIGSLEKALKGAKCLVINDDHNPTGITFSSKTVSQIMELLNRPENRNILVIVDIAYHAVRYEGVSNIAPLIQLIMDQKRGAIIWSYSKEGAMTGSRLGALALPNIPLHSSSSEITTLFQAISKLQSNVESCPPGPMQKALLSALKDEEGSQQTLHANNKILKRRRDVLSDSLSQIPGIRFTIPNSGFFFWVDKTDLLHQTRLGTCENFRCVLLKETGISVATQDQFGADSSSGQTYIRLSFSGMSEESIQLAGDQFKQWCDMKTRLRT